MSKVFTILMISILSISIFPSLNFSADKKPMKPIEFYTGYQYNLFWTAENHATAYADMRHQDPIYAWGDSKVGLYRHVGGGRYNLVGQNSRRLTGKGGLNRYTNVSNANKKQKMSTGGMWTKLQSPWESLLANLD